MTKPVLIVGGGLAGLTTAHRLHQAGIPFLLIEARDRLGGRILATDAKGECVGEGFDLGPSWCWPMMQPALGNLIVELGLSLFPQQSEGDLLFQRAQGEAPQRFAGRRQWPESMRVAGGFGQLLNALIAGLPAASIRLGLRMTQVDSTQTPLRVDCLDVDGRSLSIEAAQLVLAVPPRLLEAKVRFLPSLTPEVARRWRATPTWMAGQAKFIAVYEQPFWRQQGLSGSVHSAQGPLVEVHDASLPSGQAALLGFVGMPARQRRQLGDAVIAQFAIEQLAQLFGPAAGQPSATLWKDWAADSWTATDDDAEEEPTPANEPVPWWPDAWQRRIWLAVSETAPRDAGYLAGAVTAAEAAARQIIQQQQP